MCVPTEKEGNYCLTISGGTIGAYCIFPFKYEGTEYNGCTNADSDDGKKWCSTGVNRRGNHIIGRGMWGHCNKNCPISSSKDQNQ